MASEEDKLVTETAFYENLFDIYYADTLNSLVAERQIIREAEYRAALTSQSSRYPLHYVPPPPPPPPSPPPPAPPQSPSYFSVLPPPPPPSEPPPPVSPPSSLSVSAPTRSLVLPPSPPPLSRNLVMPTQISRTVLPPPPPPSDPPPPESDSLVANLHRTRYAPSPSIDYSADLHLDSLQARGFRAEPRTRRHELDLPPHLRPRHNEGVMRPDRLPRDYYDRRLEVHPPLLVKEREVFRPLPSVRGAPRASFPPPPPPMPPTEHLRRIDRHVSPHPHDIDRGLKRPEHDSREFRDRLNRHLSPHPLEIDRGLRRRDRDIRDRVSEDIHGKSSRDRRDSSRRSKESSSRKKRNNPDDEVPDVDSVLDLEEEIKKLTADYVQCTQHGNMYRRILHDDSTVEGTKTLRKLYDRFERKLRDRHKSLWKPREKEDPKEHQHEENPGELNKLEVVSLNLLKALDTSTLNLSAHQQVKATSTVKKMLEYAKKKRLTFSDYIAKHPPTVPRFCLAKIKFVLEQGENIKVEDLDETSPIEAGEFLSSCRKLKAHPDRLHEELWYNEPGQANDGPLCRCAPEARGTGIRHGIYPGEPAPAACHPMKNNIGKLHHYRIMVGPAVNFMSSRPTLISHNDHDYMFEGFSIFSHEPLDPFPFCDIVRFHIRYTIILTEEFPPENFCMRGVDLFEDFFFRDILELYDWHEREKSCPENTATENFRRFRFYPRFVRTLPDNGKELLSLCKVLEYFLEQDQPLVDEKDLDRLLKCSHDEWLKYTDQVRGQIVTYPGKRPSSLRVDQLDRYNRAPGEGQPVLPVDERYPLIVHFGVRPASLSYAGDPTYQRIWRSYLKLRHLMANSPKVKPSDVKKLQEREEAMRKIRKTKDMQREVTVELSSKGFRRTGIYSDMCQHALLLPVLTHHLRYYLCLSGLEKKIGYHFQERKWLSHAMNHPSSKMNFGLNPDHVRNALSNCALRVPKYGDSSIHYKYTRKRGITNLIRIMARLGQHRPVLSPIEHNERLEFLGDAVVGYLTTVHLFRMFPELSEGSLTIFRTVLVNNLHLATLAERLQLDDYMVYSHGPDLCRKADLRHAMANCFEALMGALFLEAGLDKAQELYGKFLWETEELQKVWMDLPLHPLQEEEPETDRHFIANIPVLQKLTKFEDSIGVEFNHIRLLAKAFTWRNVDENVLTYGNNQRLEFLGDSVCNLVASEYLYRFYPTHHEGHLTLLRATMVNGQTQSVVATELGMPGYVITGQNAQTQEWRVKNLADLLESLVGALFLDKGIKYVEGFMQVLFFPRLKEFILTQEWNDPKSCLQQCCLTLRQEGKEPQLPTYEVVSEGGPSHAKMYKVAVNFLGKEIGSGSGDRWTLDSMVFHTAIWIKGTKPSSIRKAERRAARAALNDYNFPQLEWQRRYVAQKHDLPYVPRKDLKTIERPDDEKDQKKSTNHFKGKKETFNGDVGKKIKNDSSHRHSNPRKRKSTSKEINEKEGKSRKLVKVTS